MHARTLQETGIYYASQARHTGRATGHGCGSNLNASCTNGPELVAYIDTLIYEHDHMTYKISTMLLEGIAVPLDIIASIRAVRLEH